MFRRRRDGPQSAGPLGPLQGPRRLRHLGRDQHLSGAGRRREGARPPLYQTLFEALAREDVHRAFGGIALPNEASVGLHLAMGFPHVGTYSEVGRKFGRFWDVAWYEKALA